MQTRPLGITIMSGLSFVGVASSLVLAMLALFAPAALDAVLRSLSPSGAGPEKIHEAMGAFLPVYYLVTATLGAALGVGFWKLWNWTRIVTLVLIGISLAALPFQIALVLQAPSASAVALTAFRLSLCALWGWYLLRPSVRAAFHSRSAPAIAA